MPQIHPPPESDTPISRPTQLTTRNGIRIESAVLPQYTFWTDRQTVSDRSVPRALTLYYW